MWNYPKDFLKKTHGKLSHFTLAMQTHTLPCQKTQQDSGFHNFDADSVSSLGVELFT